MHPGHCCGHLGIQLLIAHVSSGAAGSWQDFQLRATSHHCSQTPAGWLPQRWENRLHSQTRSSPHVARESKKFRKNCLYNTIRYPRLHKNAGPPFTKPQGFQRSDSQKRRPKIEPLFVKTPRQRTSGSFAGLHQSGGQRRRPANWLFVVLEPLLLATMGLS